MEKLLTCKSFLEAPSQNSYPLVMTNSLRAGKWQIYNLDISRWFTQILWLFFTSGQPTNQPAWVQTFLPDGPSGSPLRCLLGSAAAPTRGWEQGGVRWGCNQQKGGRMGYNSWILSYWIYIYIICVYNYSIYIYLNPIYIICNMYVYIGYI